MQYLLVHRMNTVRSGAAHIDAPIGDQRRVALITGANTGIGLETAKKLVCQGYKIILGCRNEVKGRAAVSQLQ